MLTIPNLVLDTDCEIYDILHPWMHSDFTDLFRHIIKPGIAPGAIYLIGHRQFTINISRIREMVTTGACKIILSYPFEGSMILVHKIQQYGIEDLVKDGRILLIGGGDMESCYPHLRYDNFLPKVLDFEENFQEISRGEEIFKKIYKPYKFLFLNGRQRLSRKYLIESLDCLGLLNQGLWTWLDATPSLPGKIRFMRNGEDLMSKPRDIHYLPKEYEVSRYQNNVGRKLGSRFIEFEFFNQEWGAIYLHAPAYIDTYFSIVTETVFSYPYSFRTEKIWKPIAIGHPWICVANRGFYRDLRNLGFQTFSHLIDESFDEIDDDQSRIERISSVIKDLCQSDLPSFLAAAESVCKYNQRHFVTLRPQVQKEFPERFFQFLRQHQWMI